MKNLAVLGVILAMAWLVPGPATAQQQLDSVTPVRGSTVFGTITKMSPVEVEINSRGAAKKFAVNEISKVSYGGEPAELKRARDAVVRGELESAKDDLEKISADGISRKEVVQDIAFYNAYCDGRIALAGGGDKAAAATAMLKFVEAPANQGSYHHFAGVELLGQLAVSFGSFDAAVKYFDQLAEAPWPDYKMRADVLTARALSDGGKHSDALARFDKVIANPVDSAEAMEQKAFAQVGRARCLGETGKPAEGIKAVEAVISANDAETKKQLFGRAYNALGNCYLKDGKPKDALMAFLHTHLMFYSEPEAHAEALFHLSSLFQQVNQSDRAVRARSLLQERYAGTRWAKQN